MDRYVPTGESTKGGLGEVVFCIDQNLDRNVVIKYGNQHHRLLDELAALQRIRSKHVVEIFDVVRERDGAPTGIVEELIDGEELTSKLGNIKPGDDFIRLLINWQADWRTSTQLGLSIVMSSHRTCL